MSQIQYYNHIKTDRENSRDHIAYWRKLENQEDALHRHVIWSLKQKSNFASKEKNQSNRSNKEEEDGGGGEDCKKTKDLESANKIQDLRNMKSTGTESCSELPNSWNQHSSNSCSESSELPSLNLEKNNSQMTQVHGIPVKRPKIALIHQSSILAYVKEA